MTSWMDMEQFKSQVSAPDFPGFESSAPCPSNFAEGDVYWIKEFAFPGEDNARNASLPEDVDVVIIGSGISGAAVALRLAERQPGLRVAMIEARGICSGATGRNGGHTSRAEAYDLRHVAQTIGAADAVRVRQLGMRTRDMMLETIDQLGIADEVDLQLKGCVGIFGSNEEREEYAKDIDFANKQGMQCEGYIISAEEVLQKCHVTPEVAQYGAAYLKKAGSIYPRKLVAALLRHVKSKMKDFTIHPFNPVQKVDRSTDSPASYKVVTAKGAIRARAVVHATNAYASHLIPSMNGTNGVFGCKCEVVAMQPNVATAAEAPVQGSIGYDQFWHWIVQPPRNGPFIYGWSINEKLLDYDDSKTLSDAKVRGQMVEWLEKSFPRNFQDLKWEDSATNVWTGIQGYTMDGSSLVGRPTADSPGEFMSVGHNGEGMGRCFSCSTVLVDKLLHYLDGEHGTWSAPEWFPRSFLRNV